MPRWTCILLLAVVTSALAEELKLSGYYKNLLVGSETVAPAGERYTLDVNRLRLEVKGNLAESVALDLQYDNEVLLGSYLRTAQFSAQKDAPPDQYWDLESNYAEGGSYYARHLLYRANVTFSHGATDLRVGRQRIAWGTGRFWSPLDLFNPINPIALEREERLGADAVLAEHKLGPLARISAAYARYGGNESTAALNWHANLRGIDYSLVGGRSRGENLAGIDLAGQLGGAGARAEFVQFEDHARAVLALDYAFPNTLTLSGELYYNGAGTDDTSAYDFVGLFARRIENVGRRYFGGYAAYELTPLLKWANYLVVNLGDRSRFFSPVLVFSLQPNLDVSIGAQFFGGSPGSEYARLQDLYHAQLQKFF
jgi:hypothetical protein